MDLVQRPDYSATLFGLSEGPRGIAETLRTMAAIVAGYKVNPDIRRTAVDIVRAWPEKDYPAEAQALQTWVRDNIRYTQDVNGVETIQTPDVTLLTGAGDCDDKSLLLASLLESIGHPTRFVALGYRPGEYSHVLTETYIQGLWWPLETTEPVDAGWTPPDMPYRMVQKNG